MILVLVAGVVALFCLGGAGVVFVLYDQETRIDREEPDQVVSSYLRAAVVNRDETAAGLLTCDDSPNLAQINALRDEINRREEAFDVSVVVSWGSLTRSPVGEREEQIRTELTIAGQANGQTRSRRNEQWTFRVVDQDGWRVCGASKVS